MKQGTSSNTSPAFKFLTSRIRIRHLADTRPQPGVPEIILRVMKSNHYILRVVRGGQSRAPRE
jgi:hypothetical protein